MKKKTLMVPLAALALGWACSEHAVTPLEPTSEEKPALAPRGALFDNISNNVDASVDPVAEVMALNVGGPNGTTQLGVVPTAGDGKNGCNLTGSSIVTFSVTSSNTGVATVSPSSVTFTSCGDVKTLTVTPVAGGTASITFSETANTTQNESKTGPTTFEVATATFTVNVAPPPNTAPSIAVNGVTVGGVYKKGSVPTATCQVTDAEDGNKTIAATLSAITGPNAADGVGTQTASCSYTDAGGLTAASSVSYSIIYNDATAPLIASVLNPATPDGTNGWYKSNVSLTWNVTEGESTPTLVKTGCANQNITADQAEATYNCSATSDGGSAGPAAVAIKRDGTAPTVALTGTTPSSRNGSNGWYLGDVTAAFKATDALSGFGNPSSATKTDNVTSAGEGAAVVVASPTYTDNAGNAASLSQSYKIDKTNPTAAASAPPANGNGWYNANVTVTFSGSDLASGIASCTADAIVSAEAASQVVSGICTDNAGRTSAAATVTISLDKTAPTLSGKATTNANANGWYMNDVSVGWTCADGLSGVVTCPPNTVINSEGSNLSASALISDRAGNTASANVSGINIDKTNPTVSAAVSPASPNANGWYNANVTVKFSGVDAGSGIDNCTADAVFSAEGKNQTASGTCTDKAGRTSTAATVTVSIDKTVPTISGSPTAAANGNGWYKDDVSIKWTCFDALSGIVSCPGNSLINTEGASLSVSASVSDQADNSATGTVSGIKVDKTDPVVIPAVSPSANKYDWRNSDVTVKFNGSDALSGIDDCTADVTVSSEGANRSVPGTCTDKAGNQSTASATVNIDKTAPTISGAATTSPNAKGWYKTDVSVKWTCSDALSGIVDCPTDNVLGTEGKGLSASATVSDKADNTASATVGNIDLDKTAPVVTPAVSPSANSNGWHKSDVTVSFSGSDALSGIDGCTSNVIVSTEGANRSVPGKCTDNAGNEGSASATVSLDKTAPTIIGAPKGAPNGDGWYNSTVSINWTCADAMSGVLTCSSPSEISTEGSNQSAGGSVSDNAGNTASATVTGIKLDKTAPTGVGFVGGVANGGVYYYSFVPAEPSCTASDALSGIKTCMITGYDPAIGTHTLTAIATDKAGNVQTATLSYTVNAWTLNGFYQPVDMSPNTGPLVYNTVKSGSTVPFKFEIFAGTTEMTTVGSVASFASTVTSCSLTASTDEIESTTTGGTSLRYDATAGQFIQNWQTTGKAGTCYKVVMTAQDGSNLTAYFKLK